MTTLPQPGGAPIADIPTQLADLKRSITQEIEAATAARDALREGDWLTRRSFNLVIETLTRIQRSVKS